MRIVAFVTEAAPVERVLVCIVAQRPRLQSRKRHSD